MDTIGQRLRTARLERPGGKISQPKLALACGVTRAAVSQWEKGHTVPSGPNLVSAATELGVHPRWLAEGIGPMREDGVDSMTPAASRDASELPQLPPKGEMHRDVPVLGTGAGSEKGAFQLDEDVVDRVRRPPGIAEAKNVYALYVEGDSMEPRFQEGELIYVHPDKPPAIGTYVVIQTREKEGAPVEAYIKRLARRTASKLITEQLNPAEEKVFNMDTVVAVHRVLTMNDLFGV